MFAMDYFLRFYLWFFYKKVSKFQNLSMNTFLVFVTPKLYYGALIPAALLLLLPAELPFVNFLLLLIIVVILLFHSFIIPSLDILYHFKQNKKMIYWFLACFYSFWTLKIFSKKMFFFIFQYRLLIYASMDCIWSIY